MNNIILPLILILTRFISLLPRSWFNGKNSYLWKFLGGFLKRRKSIINANIDHCFGDLSEFEKSQLKDNIWKELCSLKDISISIDLFQFGILLVDKKISKQHFVVKMR